MRSQVKPNASARWVVARPQVAIWPGPTSAPGAGVPLAALAALAGVPDASTVLVESVQPEGTFRTAVLARNQIHDGRSLLALRVNGADLSVDHGFPARTIVPAAPGVHNTKWVGGLTFRT